MAQTGLIDGLGGEEVMTFSGANLATQNAFFTGSVTSANQISGLNLFAAGSLQVGRAFISAIGSSAGSISAGRFLDFVAASGTDAFVAGSVLAAGRRLTAGGTGSPVAWTESAVQTGYYIVGAGSDGWVVFGTAFAAAPLLTVAGYRTTAAVWVGSVLAGSFYAQHATASTSGIYTAVGRVA